MILSLFCKDMMVVYNISFVLCTDILWYNYTLYCSVNSMQTKYFNSLLIAQILRGIATDSHVI